MSGIAEASSPPGSRICPGFFPPCCVSMSLGVKGWGINTGYMGQANGSAGLLSPGVAFQSCVSARALGHREVSVPIISQDIRIEGRQQPSWGLGRERGSASRLLLEEGRKWKMA